MDQAKREEIVVMLRKAYNMEVEAVLNYLANSVWLDGIRAKHIKDSLAAEVVDEMGHATLLANRIKVLEGKPPGSMELQMTQKMLQPPENSLDVLSVIQGVVAAEEQAVDHYQATIDLCRDIDPVTEDLCITLKGDEEEHRRLFKGYLVEAQQMHL